MAMEQIICLFLIICASHQPFFPIKFANFDLKNKEKIKEGNSKKKKVVIPYTIDPHSFLFMPYLAISCEICEGWRAKERLRVARFH
jgi:hypothetical protein